MLLTRRTGPWVGGCGLGRRLGRVGLHGIEKEEERIGAGRGGPRLRRREGGKVKTIPWRPKYTAGDAVAGAVRTQPGEGSTWYDHRRGLGLRLNQDTRTVLFLGLVLPGAATVVRTGGRRCWRVGEQAQLLAGHFMRVAYIASRRIYNSHRTSQAGQRGGKRRERRAPFP